MRYELEATLTETGFLIFEMATTIVVPELIFERIAPEITIVFVEGYVADVPETRVPFSFKLTSTVKEEPE